MVTLIPWYSFKEAVYRKRKEKQKKYVAELKQKK